MKISVASPLIVALLGLLLTTVSPVAAKSKEGGLPGKGKLQAIDTATQTVTLAGKTPHVYQVTPTTKIIDGSGNPTTLAAGVVGEDVGIYYTKDATGKRTLLTLRLGAKAGKEAAASTASAPEPAPTAPAAATPAPKPAPAPATAPAADASSTAAAAPVPAANTTSTKAKKERFSGKVVSVDAASGTMVVHGKADQTFTVTSSTKMTGADNLAAITPGMKVSGSYEKSADGAILTVTTLKVGK
jgi:hypothetical protein